MNLSRQSSGHYLYEFDQGFEVSYISYSPSQPHLESQLLVTLERGRDRRTFAFFQPDFNDVKKNIVTSNGIYIAADKQTGEIEVGDIAGGFAYFSAKRIRNITPSR